MIRIWDFKANLAYKVRSCLKKKKLCDFCILCPNDHISLFWSTLSSQKKQRSNFPEQGPGLLKTKTQNKSPHRCRRRQLASATRGLGCAYTCPSETSLTTRHASSFAGPPTGSHNDFQLSYPTPWAV